MNIENSSFINDCRQDVALLCRWEIVLFCRCLLLRSLSICLCHFDFEWARIVVRTKANFDFAEGLTWTYVTDVGNLTNQIVTHNIWWWHAFRIISAYLQLPCSPERYCLKLIQSLNLLTIQTHWPWYNVRNFNRKIIKFDIRLIKLNGEKLVSDKFTIKWLKCVNMTTATIYLMGIDTRFYNW